MSKTSESGIPRESDGNGFLGSLQIIQNFGIQWMESDYFQSLQIFETLELEIRNWELESIKIETFLESCNNI